MGRRRSGPWKRKQDGCWYTSRPGSKKPIKVAEADENYEAAFKRYAEFHATSPGRAEAGPDLTVAQVTDEFLDWVQQNQAEGTYLWYRGYLRRFFRFHGTRLKVGDLRPYHVHQWLAADYKGSSESHRFGAVRSICRVMNWAVRHGYIAVSPLAGMEKPTPKRRQTVVTTDQFQEMLELATDQEFHPLPSGTSWMGSHTPVLDRLKDWLLAFAPYGPLPNYCDVTSQSVEEAACRDFADRLQAILGGTGFQTVRCEPPRTRLPVVIAYEFPPIQDGQVRDQPPHDRPAHGAHR